MDQYLEVDNLISVIMNAQLYNYVSDYLLSLLL